MSIFLRWVKVWLSRLIKGSWCPIFNCKGYKDPETVICQKQSINSGSGSLGVGTSVWGYLTAGVVAANVVANLVNNANENNNNNNNNDNQDNTNNNNMNIGNSVNSNMNMNIIIPVPGGRSFDQMFIQLYVNFYLITLRKIQWHLTRKQRRV